MFIDSGSPGSNPSGDIFSSDIGTFGVDLSNPRSGPSNVFSSDSSTFDIDQGPGSNPFLIFDNPDPTISSDVRVDVAPLNPGPTFYPMYKETTQGSDSPFSYLGGGTNGLSENTDSSVVDLSKLGIDKQAIPATLNGASVGIDVSVSGGNSNTEFKEIVRPFPFGQVKDGTGRTPSMKPLGNFVDNSKKPVMRAVSKFLDLSGKKNPKMVPVATFIDKSNMTTTTEMPVLTTTQAHISVAGIGLPGVLTKSNGNTQSGGVMEPSSITLPSNTYVSLFPTETPLSPTHTTMPDGENLVVDMLYPPAPFPNSPASPTKTVLNADKARPSVAISGGNPGSRLENPNDINQINTKSFVNNVDVINGQKTNVSGTVRVPSANGENSGLQGQPMTGDSTSSNVPSTASDAAGARVPIAPPRNGQNQGRFMTDPTVQVLPGNAAASNPAERNNQNNWQGPGGTNSQGTNTINTNGRQNVNGIIPNTANVPQFNNLSSSGQQQQSVESPADTTSNQASLNNELSNVGNNLGLNNQMNAANNARGQNRVASSSTNLSPNANSVNNNNIGISSRNQVPVGTSNMQPGSNSQQLWEGQVISQNAREQPAIVSSVPSVPNNNNAFGLNSNQNGFQNIPAQSNNNNIPGGISTNQPGLQNIQNQSNLPTNVINATPWQTAQGVQTNRQSQFQGNTNRVSGNIVPNAVNEQSFATQQNLNNPRLQTGSNNIPMNSNNMQRESILLNQNNLSNNLNNVPVIPQVNGNINSNNFPNNQNGLLMNPTIPQANGNANFNNFPSIPNVPRTNQNNPGTAVTNQQTGSFQQSFQRGTNNVGAIQTGFLNQNTAFPNNVPQNSQSVNSLAPNTPTNGFQSSQNLAGGINSQGLPFGNNFPSNRLGFQNNLGSTQNTNGRFNGMQNIPGQFLNPNSLENPFMGNRNINTFVPGNQAIQNGNLFRGPPPFVNNMQPPGFFGPFDQIPQNGQMNIPPFIPFK